MIKSFPFYSFLLTSWLPTHYVSEDHLELSIFLHPAPKAWCSKCVTMTHVFLLYLALVSYGLQVISHASCLFSLDLQSENSFL